METALMAAALLGIAVDRGQTLYGVTHGFPETNPVLGPHPSVGTVNTYMVSAGLLTVGVGHVLPHDARPWWYGAIVALEAYSIMHNRALGISLQF